LHGSSLLPRTKLATTSWVCVMLDDERRDRGHSIWTLAILRRQEGEMSLTRDELSQSSCARERTAHATPARRHHTGLDPLCTTLFAPGLAPCPAPAPGSDLGPRGPDGHGRLAGHGVSPGASRYQ